MNYKSAIGIEIDHYCIRAIQLAKKKLNKKQALVPVSSAELTGTFIKDSDVVAGLKKIKDKLGVHNHKAAVVSVIGGKQVYTSRLVMQKLPAKEMKKALKYEIRKDLPFEAASSTLEYQVMPSSDMRRDDKLDVMVTATTNSLLNRHFRLLSSSGLKPTNVEALPLMVANSFWQSIDDDRGDAANIVLHLGPDIATLVIDGKFLPYFNRLIYFSSEELFSPVEESSINDDEKLRRMETLAEEVIRSLSYYEEKIENVSFSTINILGSYSEDKLLETLQEKTGLTVQVINLSEQLEHTDSLEKGKYDLPIALAMQALQ